LIRRLPSLDILVAGDVNADLLINGQARFEQGKELLLDDATLTLGGSSSITAFNLARLGVRTGIVGWVGADAFGRFVRERLEEAGVDVTWLRETRTMKSGLTIWASSGARKAGLTYPGTIAKLSSRDITADALGCARHLHIGAYFLQSGLHRGAAAVLARARRLGLTTSLDCNWDPSGAWDSGIRAALAHTDLFFPNEAEALRLTGRRNVRAAAAELATLARVVAVKRGAKGALVYGKLGWLEVKAPRVRAIDTTGAGDSFNAGFLAAYVEGKDLEACAERGVAAGARAVTRVGGTSAFAGSGLRSGRLRRAIH
jgi:sugar/nucleoside kinase (ribokinase family)